ncbi:MerR family transcriptional regulator [Labilithrix luteola]
MRIREFAKKLGVSERVVRHYEARGLLRPPRTTNGYRTFTPGDLLRAEWIRDLIGAGFSTKEIRTVVPYFEKSGPVVGEVCRTTLETKLAQIDRLLDDLRCRRAVVAERLSSLDANDLQSSARPPKPPATSRRTDHERTQHPRAALPADRRLRPRRELP